MKRAQITWGLLIMAQSLVLTASSLHVLASRDAGTATPRCATATALDTDNDGRELAYVTFTVVAPPPPQFAQPPPPIGDANLELTRRLVRPGQTIAVDYSAPDALASDAWIGILPSTIPHGSEAVNDEHDVTYQYLRHKTSGTMTFSAPQTPGRYDFRLHDTDVNGTELASVTFEVAAGR